MVDNLRYRQVHLDFHTSGDIDGIGKQFDRKEFQQTLKDAAVDSITCFSSCHHGWSYHPTKVGKMHPGLDFDLLAAQIEACKEIDINVPVYLTAGVNDVAADANPQWRQIGYDGRYLGWKPSILVPGFKNMCFNSPYMDYLCAQIAEVMERYPNCDGIFLDIITHYECCCKSCLEVMKKEGLNPAEQSDRLKCAELALLRYYEMTTCAVRNINPDMPIFHNSGHIRKDNPELLKYFSHLELESLPTGGWGYDHFPMSAKYVSTGNLQYLGMTGKFHTTWGEFGGFKHPNALLYETSAMLAFGSRCSVGDQLHPCGKLDKSTYKLIGKAYKEVAKKEKWCVDAKNIADIGLICVEAVNKSHNAREKETACDTGAARLLLEGHYLFDIIDAEADFSVYKMLILPDEVEISDKFKKKLDDYLANGGKLMLSGSSGFDGEGKPMFDLGGEFFDDSEYCPDYIEPCEDVRPDFVETPLVMYMRSKRLKASGNAKSLGKIYDPYFNREAKHFCSHQHTPYKTEHSGYDCGVINGNILYLAHPVFSIYRWYGAVAYKQYVLKCVDMLLTDNTLKTNLPSTARVAITRQSKENRLVLHLLYAEKSCRGGSMEFSGGNIKSTGQIEVIEELSALHNIKITIKTDKPIKTATLQPEGKSLQFDYSNDEISIKLESFCCHAMIVLDY